MVTFPLAPFAVTLGKSVLAGQADTVTMPERHHKIDPFHAPIGTFRAGEQFVYAWKSFVGKRNEIVFQCHHIFHVEVVLAGTQFQLFSNCFHRSIFPQIYPVVKSVLRNFHSVGLVRFDLADGTSAALFDEQWIDHGNTDTITIRSNSMTKKPWEKELNPSK